MNKHEFGMRGEDIACKWITSHGGEILKRNFRFRGGEIDVIYRDGAYTVFGEVKYRTSGVYGDAAEAVDFRKQKTISRGCDFYRKMTKMPEDTPIRFDVIALNLDRERNSVRIRLLKNAFDYIPYFGRR